MPRLTAQLVGPDLQAAFAKILAAASVDASLKEPLRKRLQPWQKAVLARMKADAPDDPETGGSRLERAMRTGLMISRGRQRMILSFILDSAKLGQSAGGRNTSERRGLAWALSQHEDLTLKHKRGGAKFMERPFKQAAGRVPDLVGEALEEVTSRLERA